MKVCAMVDRSAGNESVGDMWTDTASFPESATLAEVLEWAGMACKHDRFIDHAIVKSRDYNTRINVRLALLQEPEGAKE